MTASYRQFLPTPGDFEVVERMGGYILRLRGHAIWIVYYLNSTAPELSVYRVFRAVKPGRRGAHFWETDNVCVGSRDGVVTLERSCELSRNAVPESSA